MDMMKYCPKCALEESRSHLQQCEYCKTHLSEADISFNEWNMMDTGQKMRWYNHLLECKIKQGEEYEEAAQSHRQQEHARKIIERHSGSSSSPKCPSCGSSNFQMVNRKWSLLAGFFTQKVDRVCVNCKTRF